jgi:hypothetical protein
MISYILRFRRPIVYFDFPPIHFERSHGKASRMHRSRISSACGIPAKSTPLRTPPVIEPHGEADAGHLFDHGCMLRAKVGCSKRWYNQWIIHPISSECSWIGAVEIVISAKHSSSVN